MKISEVSDENIAEVQKFLDEHSETALFLASNLLTYGPRLRDAMNSGNFKCIRSDNEILGVFCLSRRGNLLAETGGRTDFARPILDTCEVESIPIQGVIGEWYLSAAIWNLMKDSKGFMEHYNTKEILYRLYLSPGHNIEIDQSNVRQLISSDFEQWIKLNTAFMDEEGMPVQGTIEQRRINFKENTQAGRWWGYFHNGQLIATVALNAVYKQIGQVGGVYTDPRWRRQGLSRAIMNVMIKDCMQIHKFQKLILFTGEKNKAARSLYESLGFVEIGSFGLFFGLNKG